MTINLAVEPRDIAKSVTALREAGKVPAVVYGPKQEPLAITVDAKAFATVREEAGESTIITLDGLAQPVEVLIKEVDFSPVQQRVLHADLYAIERGKEMTVTVELVFVGESPAEEDKIGTVTRVLHEIDVTCRPSNLPSHIDVDISKLVDEESKIVVSDLPQLEGVVYDAEPEEVVAVVSVKEEESDEEPEEIDMDAIETEKKGAEASETGEEE